MSQIMEIRFNREKEERKALVKAIGEILGCAPVYMRAPSLAYTVGDYTIDRYGTLSFDERVNVEDAQRLLAELSANGYVGEGVADLVAPSDPAPTERDVVANDAEDVEATEEQPAIDDTEGSACGDSSEAVDEDAPALEASALGRLRSVVDEDGYHLTIEVPFVGFTTTALENLERLVSGKAGLIMKAIGAVELPIKREADTLRFPWFPTVSSHLEVDAYARLVHALCEMAKKQKRVTLKEKEADPDASEKFAFRCFLLRLGFIGKEYASARKVLLSKLSGNGSFKNGEHKSRGMADSAVAACTHTSACGSTSAEAVVDENAESVSDIENAETVAVIPTPLRCQECYHHCYCAEDGMLRTSTGAVVDTSKRTPDKYTHYCLGVPSGYRKLKHAVDWSGGETPPKWCPLKVQEGDSFTANDSAEENISADDAVMV